LPAACGGGADLAVLPFEGASAFFALPHQSRLPVQDFSRVAAWLAEGAPPASRAALPAGNVELEAAPGVVERPLRFGPDGRLAGVLCRPRHGAWRRAAVLLLNTGANPRAGVGRLGTRMARHLATQGFCSLRMDAAGIGDSDAEPDAADPAAAPDMFHGTAVRDAASGLDALAAHGHPQALGVGVCAGAHAAFQLALWDPRLGGLALFNLPAFDRAAGGAPALDGGPPPGESRWARRPRMLLRRLRAKADMALAEWLGLDPGLDRACGWVRGLALRGTRVLLAYSERDRGLRELRAHFGRGGHALAGFGVVRRVLLDGADHSLLPRSMQDQALELVLQEALSLDRAAAPAPAAMPAGEPWRAATALPPGPLAAG
jgi:hypothetical protein